MSHTSPKQSQNMPERACPQVGRQHLSSVFPGSVFASGFGALAEELQDRAKIEQIYTHTSFSSFTTEVTTF